MAGRMHSEPRPGSQGSAQAPVVHTPAPGVPADDRRRLDLVVYGATPRGGALCCDATLVSPLARTGHPQPGAADTDGAVLRVAERCKRSTYPELCRAGPQELVVLGAEIGGRWNDEAGRFVHYFCASGRSERLPLFAARSGWSRRWWGRLRVAVQQAVASTALDACPRDQPPSSGCLSSQAPRALVACRCASKPAPGGVVWRSGTAALQTEKRREK